MIQAGKEEIENCETILKTANAAISAMHNTMPDDVSETTQTPVSGSKPGKAVQFGLEKNISHSIPKEGKGKPTPKIKGIEAK